jgi:hypothetical protein
MTTAAGNSCPITSLPKVKDFKISWLGAVREKYNNEVLIKVINAAITK